MASIFSKETLLPENVALVVHHPMYIFKSGKILHQKRYSKIVDYIKRMHDIGVVIVYFAYPYNFDTIMLKNCDFSIFQARGKSSKVPWKHFIQTLINEKVVEKNKIKELSKNERLKPIKPKKIEAMIRQRLKEKTCAIVYSHREAGMVIADLLDKEMGPDLKKVYMIGGPIEGCLPMNVDYLNRVLEKRDVDLKLIGELITHEQADSKKYKSPAGTYCSRCRMPSEECICRNKEIAKDFKVDIEKIRRTWQTHFSKFDAEEIYNILEENLEKRMRE